MVAHFTSRFMVSGTSYCTRTTHNSTPRKICGTKKLRKNQTVAKQPNKIFGANCFSKEPWQVATLT